MNKKIAIFIIVTSVLALVQLAEAQTAKIPRIGVLHGGSAPTEAVNNDAFLQGLRELGYIVGKNILIEHRYTEGKAARSAEHAAELVRLRVDVIVGPGAGGVQDAKKATNRIPIVMTNVSDPVALGFVASLAKPGGNITGVTNQSPELCGKRLQLLKEVIPSLSRVAVLWQPGGRGSELRVKETENVAPSLGIKLQLVEVREANDFEGAFSAMKKERVDALVPHMSPLIGSQAKRIIELAAKNRIPAMYDEGRFMEAGGLMSYGTDIAALRHRAATYVDKILKGAKPADLPVEQPTKFEFVVNLKTAKQIGLTIPANVLMRADRVIQ